MGIKYKTSRNNQTFKSLNSHLFQGKAENNASKRILEALKVILKKTRKVWGAKISKKTQGKSKNSSRPEIAK